MTRGGKRPGAGRPRGGHDKVSAKVRAEAEASGELPHEFLLRVSRGEKIGEHAPTFSERMAAAKEAAPFYAPKLSSVDSRVNATVTHEDALKELE